MSKLRLYFILDELIRTSVGNAIVNLSVMPRYSLMNADGKIADDDALRPSDRNLVIEIEELLQKSK